MRCSLFPTPLHLLFLSFTISGNILNYYKPAKYCCCTLKDSRCLILETHNILLCKYITTSDKIIRPIKRCIICTAYYGVYLHNIHAFKERVRYLATYNLDYLDIFISEIVQSFKTTPCFVIIMVCNPEKKFHLIQFLLTNKCIM